MLHSVVKRILAEKENSDHPSSKLMGVTGSNAYLISVRDGHVCRILIVGVVELQGLLYNRILYIHNLNINVMRKNAFKMFKIKKKLQKLEFYD
jgi:hypothetical protein